MSLSLHAEETQTGVVHLPLDAYQDLYNKVVALPDAEKPPPVGVTLSIAELEVEVPKEAGRPAEVVARVTVHVLTDEWIAVPILPAGTSVKSATLDGQAIALALLRGDLVWFTKSKGQHLLELAYTTQVLEAATGRALHVPVPAAASTRLRASLSGEGLRVTAVPASGVNISESGGTTVLEATVPKTTGIQISWWIPGRERALITAADYTGTLRSDVVAWQAEVSVKVLTADPVSVPLLSNSVALVGARVDGRRAVVAEDDSKLSVQLRGVGVHKVKLQFETPVRQEGGPTATSLWLPRPPVSSFMLTLAGKKEVSVSPRAGVQIRRKGNQTVATIHLPPTDQATFSWSEALPEAAEEKLRANAEVYHVVRADEGVVQIRALVAFQTTRGVTNILEAALPAGVVVNQVSGEGVTDWRVFKKQNRQLLTVYLDRDLKGDYRYRIDYELLIGSKGDQKTPVGIPLVVPGQVHRQRGMLALISGTELSMQPKEDAGMTKVGENQLPAWVRQDISQTVAHTYKYVEKDARLAVLLVPPERKRGKFDAVVDTLFSVGDGVMKASATVEIAIKSGKLMDLDLNLPKEINLISVTAPSLRDHQVIGEEDEQSSGQLLRLMFTQEMEGTLRVEIAYERVLSGGQEQVTVPAIHVNEADMEQGRLAVEALTAVEVQTAAAERVLPLDVQELPRQLTLRTTNPILLAYKYVHAEPPFDLVLEVKHHAEMKVQVAAIDQADYQTLYTEHGLALSRVVYHVRNRRKQFLKVELPQGSELWSAMLSGHPVKPARGEKDEVVLVPLLKSAAPFQVEIVYATTVPTLGFAGSLQGVLSVPDIVETRSTWDVFLPERLSYGGVDSNMTILEKGNGARDLNGVMDASLQQAADEHAGKSIAGAGTGTPGPSGVLPLRIHVPRQGIHYRLEKLFANRGEERARFEISYTTAGAQTFGGLLMILSVLILAALVAGRIGMAPRLTTGPSTALGIGALITLVISVTLLGADLTWAVVAIGLAALLVTAQTLMRRRKITE
jgi:hypothetical protein